jgi:hypothetical protein
MSYTLARAPRAAGAVGGLRPASPLIFIAAGAKPKPANA